MKKLKLWVAKLIRASIEEEYWWADTSIQRDIKRIIDIKIDSEVKKKIAEVKVSPEDIQQIIEHYYARKEIENLVNSFVEGERFIDEIAERITRKQVCR